MFLIERMQNYIDQYGDPRTKHWFLVTTPWECISLTILYLLSVKVFLPAYMKNRTPCKPTNVIFYYNVFQVVFSLYLVYMSLFCGWVRRYSLFSCRDVDRSMDPDAIMAARAIYWYYIAKLTEFLDTIFFVLRKKDNQISFLHLYHHATMPFNAWLTVMFLPGGTPTKLVALNSAIHVVMYTYYLLSGLGPKWQKYVWWKKYLTRFQIIQFAYGLIHLLVVLYTRSNCPEYFKFPAIIYYSGFYILSLLVLFIKFYKDSYKVKMHVNKHK